MSSRSSMKGVLTFLLNVSRLKTIPRTGWVWLGVKNPETIAEHSFRTAFMVWVIGHRTRLNQKRLLETALLHDTCEVYAGDITPYYGFLPRDRRKRMAILKRWVRLPRKQKERHALRKFSLEKRSLLKLLRPLPFRIREEIFTFWLDFEKRTSAEGKFVKQVDRIEALLQAIDYFGTQPDTPVVGWWEGLEELVEHPSLVEFLKTVEGHLYHQKRTRLDAPLEFLIKAGRLKRMPRLGWIKRGVKHPDSLANHAFMVALMSWLLAQEARRRLNLERLLKMALSHHLFAVTLPQRTPYDAALENAKTAKDRTRVFNAWLRSSLKEKRDTFRRSSRQEIRAVWRLTARLRAPLRSEIRELWQELRANESAEARFVNQMAITELLLQGLRYWDKGKSFPIAGFWERAYENIDDPLILEFLVELKKRFYRGRGM